MGKIIIDIKDKSKEMIVINLLKELPFIELKEFKKSNKTKSSDFRKLFGLWRGREVCSNDIRSGISLTNRGCSHINPVVAKNVSDKQASPSIANGYDSLNDAWRTSS